MAILMLKLQKKLTRYYIKRGIKSLYVCGSTGEGFLLDNEERKKIVEVVKEEAGDEMTIIVTLLSLFTTFLN